MALCGCAANKTINKTPLTQASIPQSSVPQVQNLVQINICHQNTLNGDLSTAVISLNGKPLSRLSSGKCITTNVPLGTHVISNMQHGTSKLEKNEFKFVVSNDKTKYFKSSNEGIVEIIEKDDSLTSKY
jgi:hypothetical protein